MQDTRLRDMIDAAAGYMARQRAEELARNVYMGLEQLDFEGASRFERWAHVLGHLDLLISRKGVKCMLPGNAAEAVLAAWEAPPGRAA